MSNFRASRLGAFTYEFEGREEGEGTTFCLAVVVPGLADFPEESEHVIERKKVKRFGRGLTTLLSSSFPVRLQLVLRNSLLEREPVVEKPAGEGVRDRFSVRIPDKLLLELDAAGLARLKVAIKNKFIDMKNNEETLELLHF